MARKGKKGKALEASRRFVNDTQPFVVVTISSDAIGGVGDASSRVACEQLESLVSCNKQGGGSGVVASNRGIARKEMAGSEHFNSESYNNIIGNNVAIQQTTNHIVELLSQLQQNVGQISLGQGSPANESYFLAHIASQLQLQSQLGKIRQFVASEVSASASLCQQQCDNQNAINILISAIQDQYDLLNQTGANFYGAGYHSQFQPWLTSLLVVPIANIYQSLGCRCDVVDKSDIEIICHLRSDLHAQLNARIIEFSAVKNSLIAFKKQLAAQLSGLLEGQINQELAAQLSLSEGHKQSAAQLSASQPVETTQRVVDNGSNANTDSDDEAKEDEEESKAVDKVQVVINSLAADEVKVVINSPGGAKQEKNLESWRTVGELKLQLITTEGRNMEECVRAMAVMSLFSAGNENEHEDNCALSSLMGEDHQQPVQLFNCRTKLDGAHISYKTILSGKNYLKSLVQESTVAIEKQYRALEDACLQAYGEDRRLQCQSYLHDFLVGPIEIIYQLCKASVNVSNLRESFHLKSASEIISGLIEYLRRLLEQGNIEVNVGLLKKGLSHLEEQLIAALNMMLKFQDKNQEAAQPSSARLPARTEDKKPAAQPSTGQPADEGKAINDETLQQPADEGKAINDETLQQPADEGKAINDETRQQPADEGKAINDETRQQPADEGKDINTVTVTINSPDGSLQQKKCAATLTVGELRHQLLAPAVAEPTSGAGTAKSLGALADAVAAINLFSAGSENKLTDDRTLSSLPGADQQAITLFQQIVLEQAKFRPSGSLFAAAKKELKKPIPEQKKNGEPELCYIMR